MSCTLRLWLIAALCSFSARSAHADPPSPAGENMRSLEALLDESVVTTASRSAGLASTAPSAMFTITAAEIRLYGIRSIDEALALLGVEMRVEKARDYYTGVDVGVRGLMLRDYGRHLLVLLDGHVMNSQASGEITLHEGLGVPLELIDHIEVMLGAGSVMYGSNAMTAVVHVVTKRAERDRGVHAVAELSLAPPTDDAGYARAPGGANHVGLRYRLGLGAADSFTLAGLPGSATVRAEWQHDASQTYRVTPVAGDNWQKRPDESTWGGTASHRMFAPSLVTALNLGDFKLQLQTVRYERTMPLVALFDDQHAQERRTTVRLDLTHDKQLSRTLHLTSRIYADYMRQSHSTTWSSLYWCAPGQIDGCTYNERTVSRWVGIEQQLRFEPNANSTLSTVLGYDLRLRDASSRPADSRDRISGEFPPNVWVPYFHEQSVLGALFLQQIYAPVSWLSLNAGVRLDIDSLFGARPSPRIAAVFVPAPDTSLRIAYSEAFRAPTASELYSSDPTYVLAPQSLGPEIVRTPEVSWHQRFGVVSFALRGWIAWYQDIINQRHATVSETDRGIAEHALVSTVTPDYVVVNDNISRITAYGGSLTLQARLLPGLTAAASITVSRYRSPGLTESLWPHSFGNFRLSYALAPDGAALALAGTFAHRRLAFNSYADSWADAARVPVSDSLDLRLTFTSPIHAVSGLTMRASTGLRVFPDSPYLITGPTEALEDTRKQFNHDVPQLYVLLGVGYDP